MQPLSVAQLRVRRSDLGDRAAGSSTAHYERLRVRAERFGDPLEARDLRSDFEHIENVRNRCFKLQLNLN